MPAGFCIICESKGILPTGGDPVERKNMHNVHIPPITLAMEGGAMLPFPIVTDPNGSYTGRPKDPEERPIQDADDL